MHQTGMLGLLGIMPLMHLLPDAMMTADIKAAGTMTATGQAIETGSRMTEALQGTTTGTGLTGLGCPESAAPVCLVQHAPTERDQQPVSAMRRTLLCRTVAVHILCF